VCASRSPPASPLAPAWQLPTLRTAADEPLFRRTLVSLDGDVARGPGLLHQAASRLAGLRERADAAASAPLMVLLERLTSCDGRVVHLPQGFAEYLASQW
jgi:hypothetical protein